MAKAKKKVYIVSALIKESKVRVNSDPELELPVKMDWADGMCGAMPVFTNKMKARRYAGKRFEVIEAEV